MARATNLQTIVIAWVTMEGFELTGRYLDRYKLEPESRPVELARACTWLLEGTAEDVAKAQAHLARKHAGTVRAAVFTFPTSTADPLARARARILRQGGLVGSAVVDDVIEILWGAVENKRAGGGWLPQLWINGRASGNTWAARGYDRETAEAMAERDAAAELARYIGDWKATTAKRS